MGVKYNGYTHTYSCFGFGAQNILAGVFWRGKDDAPGGGFIANVERGSASMFVFFVGDGVRSWKFSFISVMKLGG